MGSTTTEVNEYDQNDGTEAVVVDTADTTEDSSEKVAEIRNDIEATRAEMSETVDALQEKLNPEHIKEQVVDSVREATIGRAENMVSSASETVRGTGTSIVDRITDNPIPAAMVGIGIGWMLLNNSNRAAVAKYQAQSRAKDISRDVSDNVQFKAMQVQEKAGELAEHAQDQAGHLAERAHDQVEHVASQSHQLMESSPLIAGALAIALGAAAGFLVPETSRENELMGPTRDRLLDQAKEMAGETMGKVQQVASEATQAATEAAKQAAQDEAKIQGLAKPENALA